MSITEALHVTAQVITPLGFIAVAFVTGYILGTVDLIEKIFRSKK